MFFGVGTDVKSNMEVIQDVTAQVQAADPDKVKEYFGDLMMSLLDFGVKVILAIIIYVIGVKIIKFLRKLLRRFLERSGADAGVKQFLDSFIRVALYFCLIAVICGWFGVSTASVVALLGSAGLAVGLALQGSLSNFAGGVLILVIKPFKVGDYIIEDNEKNEGIVTEIQLFYTKLLTVDNRVVIIPNGILANSSLTNATDQEKRRVDIYVGISYHADLNRAKDLLKELLIREERRLPEEEMTVFVHELGESSVKLGCRVWVRTEDYWTVKWRLTEEIKSTFDKNEIEIPFNQLEVSIKRDGE